MRQVRIGLIGCGGIARGAHLPAIAYLRDRVRLVAAADVNGQAAAAAAAPWGATPYTDYRALLERSDVEMVLVATPEFLHAEQVAAAAAAGKHVLCEKPMAPTLREADAMIAACRRAGVRLMIGHSRRSTRRYLEVRAAINRGEIGAVRLVRENERRSRAPLGRTGPYWSPAHWTGDPAVSVGAALTNGIHETDLLRWFAGAEPESVYAEHKVSVEGNQGVPDFITFTVRFRGGAIGSAEISNVVPPGYPAFHQLEVYGTEGAIRARDHDQLPFTRYDEGGASLGDTAPLFLHHADAYRRQLALFVQALVADAPVPLAPEDARAALRLALAAVEAAKTGRPVHLGGEEA